MVLRHRDTELGGPVIYVAVPVILIVEQSNPCRASRSSRDARDQTPVSRTSPTLYVACKVQLPQRLVDGRAIRRSAPEGGLVEHLPHERKVVIRNGQEGEVQHVIEDAIAERHVLASAGTSIPPGAIARTSRSQSSGARTSKTLADASTVRFQQVTGPGKISQADT